METVNAINGGSAMDEMTTTAIIPEAITAPEAVSATAEISLVTTGLTLNRNEIKNGKKSPVTIQTAFAPFLQQVQSADKIDFNISENEMTMEGLDIRLGSHGVYPTTPEFRKQMYQGLGSGLGTYGAYLEGTGEIKLLNENVNRLKSKSEDSRIVRTLDGFARAEVSDKFLAIDNDVIFSRVYESFKDIEQKYRFMKSHVSANSASIKFLSVEKFATLGNRDLYHGFMISNSEIGKGYCKFEVFLCDAFCTNGMIFSKREIASLKFKHLGAQILNTGRVNLALDNVKRTAICMELDKALNTASSVIPNHGLKEKLEYSYAKRIDGNLGLAIDETIKRYSIPASRETIQLHMVAGENSVYGIQAGITKYAQSMENYEDRLKLEMIGGAILEDTPTLYPVLEAVAKVA